MKRLFLTPLAGLLFGGVAQAAPPPCVPPGFVPLSMDEMARNGAVVKSGDRDGMGFVIGWRNGEAWIAVPSHVVFGKGVRPSPLDMPSVRAGLEVRFVGESAARQLCDKDPVPQGAVDLAFVCVEWNERPLFSEGVLARRVREGDELTLVDVASGDRYSGSLTKAPRPGEVVGERGDMEADGFAGVEGQSGAPTANGAGVVGLYLGKRTSRHILSMSAIRKQAKLALVPWQLFDAESYDCAVNRNVCLSFDTEVAPEGATLRSIFSPGSYPLRAGGCAALPEGRYEIEVRGGSSCEPKVVTVLSAEDDLRLSLRCSVALMGIWRTQDGDELSCVEIQMGRAQCAGLGRQGLGLFEGTVSAQGRDFSILGSFYDPSGNRRDATGSLRWSGGRLEGEIRRQLEPPRPLKLERVEEP